MKTIRIQSVIGTFVSGHQIVSVMVLSSVCTQITHNSLGFKKLIFRRILLIKIIKPLQEKLFITPIKAFYKALISEPSKNYTSISFNKSQNKMFSSLYYFVQRIKTNHFTESKIKLSKNVWQPKYFSTRNVCFKLYNENLILYSWFF